MELGGSTDLAPRLPSGDHFEGAGYPLEDVVMTTDSTVPVDVGVTVQGLSATTTQGHFLDPTKQTESCLVSEVSTVFGPDTERGVSLGVLVSPLYTVPCDFRLEKCWVYGADSGQLKRATWRRCMILLAHSANLYTVRAKCVCLSALRVVLGKIHNIRNWWCVNVCSVQCVMTIQATSVFGFWFVMPPHS